MTEPPKRKLFQADPTRMPPNPKAPRPGIDKHPVWHCTFTADEMAEISKLRGPSKGLAGMKKFVMDAVFEKAHREAGSGYTGKDLESLTPKELQSLALNIIGTQMERAAQTVSKPGYRWDVKGELLVDPEGNPAQDIDQVTKAQAELRQWLKSLREIKGLDAPSKKRVKMTVVHQQIVELAQQMGIETDPDGDEMLALPAGEDEGAA